MRIPPSNATECCEAAGWGLGGCCAVTPSGKAATTRSRTTGRPMPNIRLALWGVLAAILFLNYQTWLHDYEPPVGASTVQTSGGSAPTAAAPANTLADSLPQSQTPAANAASGATSTTPPALPAMDGEPAASSSEAPNGPLPVRPDV